MNLTLDPDSLTLGELEKLEEYSGLTVGALTSALSAGDWSTRTLLGVVTVIQQRDNPSFTLDDARALRVADITVDAPDTPKG